MSQQINDGDLSLRELFASLWAGRKLILATTVLAGLISTGVAFVIPPVYQTQARLLPPLQGDIAVMNLGRKNAGMWQFEIDQVYSFFTRILISETARRRLFNEVYLPSLTPAEREQPQDELWDDFNEDFYIEMPEQQASRTTGQRLIRAEGKDPEKLTRLISAYITIVTEMAEQEFAANIQKEVGAYLADIDRQMAFVRNSALTDRQDRITRLREALQVARSVGQEKPQVAVPNRVPSDGVLASLVDGTHLYQRGAKALESEIAVLEARESDDPFIKQLRNLKLRRQKLEALDVGTRGARMYTVDAAPELPETPVRPKKSLLVMIGAALGALTGMLVSLVLYSRKEDEQPAAPATRDA